MGKDDSYVAFGHAAARAVDINIRQLLGVRPGATQSSMQAILRDRVRGHALDQKEQTAGRHESGVGEVSYEVR